MDKRTDQRVRKEAGTPCVRAADLTGFRTAQETGESQRPPALPFVSLVDHYGMSCLALSYSPHKHTQRQTDAETNRHKACVHAHTPLALWSELYPKHSSSYVSALRAPD